MKIDVCYELDGFINCPVGEGSYIRRTVRFYEGCKDEPDCRAGKGWPEGTISREYFDITKTYDVLFGTKTGELAESLKQSFPPESKVAYLDGEIEISNLCKLPLGIFRNSEGIPISVHRGHWVGGSPLTPNNWFTTESVDDVVYQLLFSGMKYGIIEVPEMNSFKDFLSEKIV